VFFKLHCANRQFGIRVRYQTFDEMHGIFVVSSGNNEKILLILYILSNLLTVNRQQSFPEKP